ncbi:MAG: lipopolysaccharide heptosyltransferase I [Campylobacterales bacterium]|nr:lipopolysaccharide heptosyltransferase I [Campylobacterales bacterium]
MKIAIVRLSALGDIIQSQVVLQFIKQEFPQSHIDWFCDDALKEILENNPLVDNVIGIRLKELKKNFSFSFLIKEYKKIKNYDDYDYIIDLQGLIKSALIARIIGKKTYGFAKNSLRESFASNFYKQDFEILYSENVIKRYVGLISKIFEISIGQEELESKEKILGYENENKNQYLKDNTKNIVFILGASWDSKVYPAEKMAEVANQLECNPIVVWGSDKEYKMAEEFKSHCSKAVICEKLSLNSLVELISISDLCIGPDTGPTHIAWANNVSSITIFGPTPYFRNTLITNISKTVDTGKEIDPLNLDKTDFDIENIEPEKIIKTAKELL